MPVHRLMPKKQPSVCCPCATSVVALAALWLAMAPAARADDAAAPTAPGTYDYAAPKLVTGTLYAPGSHRQKMLFTFRRTAARSGGTVDVVRQFLTTNGTVAAVEKIVYNRDQLVSYEMQEFQAQVSGAIRILPDPKKPGRQKLFISYGRGLIPPAKGSSENLPPDTVVDDTLYPFLLAHWDDLMRGDAVKFHFVSLEWKRTFVFRFVKAGELVQNGRPVVRVKMEPASLLLARFVNPLVFTVEKDPPHRILSYLGRTTPRVKKGKNWKYLDAETVFDWPD